jgi:membrane fusion protein, multidrug efflux system
LTSGIDRPSHESLGGLAKAEESDRTPPRAQTRTMIRIGIGISSLFLVLLVVGLFPKVRDRRELVLSSQKAQNAVRKVNVVRPEPASAVGLSLAATTQAIQDAVVYARTSGYLSKRHVDIGDHVTAGQLLAEIESPEIDQQLRQAKSDLLQSKRSLDLQKANLDLARATMARYQAADRERAVAKEALDQSVATFRTAQAAVAAAEANVQSNEANVQRLEELTSFERVLAPFDGTVIQRNVDAGALITAGSPTNNTAVAPSSVAGGANGLFEVAAIDTLRVFVNVPQAYAPNVNAGLPVQVTVRGQLAQPVTGTVTRTANALDPGTRTLLTEIDIPNQSHKILPGMFVYANLTIAPFGTRWRIPATALIFDAQGTRVAIVGADNKLRFQDVELGRDFGDKIDVQAGLQGNEAIVKQPLVSLQEGQLVTPIEAQEPRGG